MKSFQIYFYFFLAGLSCICGGSNAYAADGFSMATDSNGNGASAWVEPTSDQQDIFIQANVYLAGIGWGSPTAISTPVNNLDFPKIQAAANGSDIAVVVMWTESHNTTQLFAAMLPNSTSNWIGPVQVSDNSESILSPQFNLRIDSSLNILAVWSSYAADSNEYIRSATANFTSTNNTWTWNPPVNVSGP